jgi:PKD repeat protein
MKTILFSFLLFLCSLLRAQEGFERTYIYGDSLMSFFGNIHPVVDGYYVFGSKVSAYNPPWGNVFGKLDLEGNLVQQSNYVKDTVSLAGYFGTSTENNKNTQGNYVYAGISRSIPSEFKQYIFIQEISPSGQLLFDSIYTNFHEEDSLNLTYSSAAVLQDGNYLISFEYTQMVFDSNRVIIDALRIGTFVFKCTPQGTILWKKKYFAPSPNPKAARYTRQRVMVNPDGSFVIKASKQTQVTVCYNEGRMTFISCDANGNVLNIKQYYDSPFTCAMSGHVELPDGTSVSSFWNDTVRYNGFNCTEWYRSCIGRFDANRQVIWKQPLMRGVANDLAPITEVMDIAYRDSSIYFECYHNNKVYNYDQPGVDSLYVTECRVYKMNAYTGEIVWKRNFKSFIDSATWFLEIRDVDTTSDGGVVFAGNLLSYDKQAKNKAYARAYVLKTNCLGFTVPATAGASILSSSKDSVVFLNQSMAAGSYIWHFGDGTQLTTPEFSDTIVHNYATPGTYQITLIAQGCSNRNDTLRFLHTIAAPIEEPTQPILHQNNPYFLVYPNPTQQGQNLGILAGSIPENAHFAFYDNQGKLIHIKKNIVAATMYFIETTSLAKGSYRLVLLQEDRVLKAEQVIIN